MTGDENQAAADLAPRGWRNYTRSRRAQELRRDLAATDESMTPTDWWLEDADSGTPE
jgi:hypothetical protein